MFISDTVVIRFVIKRGFLIMPLKACLPFHCCLLPFIGVATREAEIPPELLARDLGYDCAWVSFQLCGSCGPRSFSETSRRAVPQIPIKSPHKVRYFFLHSDNSVGCDQSPNTCRQEPGAFPCFSMSIKDAAPALWMESGTQKLRVVRFAGSLSLYHRGNAGSFFCGL